MSQQMLDEQVFSTENVAVLAGPGRAGRAMTVSGTVSRSLMLVMVTGVFAWVGWTNAAEVIQVTSGPAWLLGYMFLLGLSFVAMAHPRLAMPGSLIYSVLMGLWVGGISGVYEQAYDGIVGQALLATVATLVVCLVLYQVGAVQVTERFVSVVIAATLGIALLYLVAWILSLFGTDLRFWTDPTPLGIAISVVICLVAAANLFISFASIDLGVERRAPAFMEWYAAWGLLSTLVWLYLEILRLLARINARQ